MNAEVLFEALAILRTLKDMDTREFPAGLKWHRVMTAHNTLEFALMRAGLKVPIEAPQAEQVPA